MNIQPSKGNFVSGGSAPPDMVRVWDIVVRIFHWSLVGLFAAAWLTADDFVKVHEPLGYALLGLIAVRLVWGVVGGKYARFTGFVRSPATVIAYLRDVRSGRSARFLGHNPAGGAMVIALLLALAITAGSGWMSTTDTWWGIRWVEELHELAAHATLVLIAVHIAGVLHASLAHNENLIKAMFTGLKRKD